MTSKVLCALGVKDGRTEYLYDFSWDCDWYWGGGYVGNKHFHHHFDHLVSGNINMFDGFKRYYDSTKLSDEQLWRLCDLMKQFYSHRESADCFQWGGGYTSSDRNHEEINPELAKSLNEQIEKYIIPEVRKLLKYVDKQPVWSLNK